MCCSAIIIDSNALIILTLHWRREWLQFLPLSHSEGPVLSQVYSFCARGWPTTSHSLDKKLIPFFNKRLQLTTHNGCLLWGLRVVIPSRYQRSILELLHEGHPGMSRMKSLARLHVWWPSLDTDIESHVKPCVNCAETAKDPTKVPLHQWDFPAKPWQRLHIDFRGHIETRCGCY